MQTIWVSEVKYAVQQVNDSRCVKSTGKVSVVSSRVCLLSLWSSVEYASEDKKTKGFISFKHISH